MLVRRLPIRRSTFASLQQLLNERTRALDSRTLTFRDTFDKFTLDNAKSVHLALNRLLPAQEQRVDMVLRELTQLSTVEKRAFFAVFTEARKQKFMGVRGEAKVATDPLETGEHWPFTHPRNIQFQQETQQSGQLGLHGLPAAFLKKLESGEAFQSLESVEVSAPAAETKQEKKVEEVKEEKTSFNLVLKGFAPDAKLKVIKEVKTVLNLGLKEAKDKVEGAAKEPCLLYKNVSKDSVKAAFDKLTAAGAVMEWT